MDSTVTVPLATVSHWAAQITASWRSSVQGIFEVGRLLTEAQDALPYGEWEAMCENSLPFKQRTAARLMAIAGDKRIAEDQTRVSLLPPHWGTVYEITRLDDDVLEYAFLDGTIHPDMKRNAISGQVKQAKRAAREQSLGAKQAALPTRQYGVIVADPEWRFEPWSRKTGMDRAADNHYPTSTIDVIMSRPIEQIAADDCVLFLWATAPMLRQALAVMEAWGFTYRSNYVWDKGRDGTGYWNRNAHEHLLIGVKGNIPAPAPGTQRSSLIASPVELHSAKPEVFLEMIETYFPTLQKIELNRRGPARPGWDAWGNEAEQTERAASATDHAAPDAAPCPPPDSVGAASPFTDDLDLPQFLRRAP